MAELAQILDWYSATALKQIAAARGRSAKSTKAQIIYDLSRVLWEPREIAKVLETLTPAQLAALQRAKQYGGRGLHPALLQAQLEADGLPDAQAAIHSLLRLGLLVYDTRGGGQWELWPSASYGYAYTYMYAKPSLMLAPPAAEQVELPPDLGRLPAAPWTEPLQGVEEGSFSALQRDLYQFVQYLRASRVKLLKSGLMGKRDFTRLNQSLSERDDLTGVYTFDETHRLRFLSMLLAAAKLMAVVGEDLRATPAADEFFRKPDPEQARALVQAWLPLGEWNEFWFIPWIDVNSYDGTGDVPTPTRLAAARRDILDLLDRERPHGQWFSIPAFIASMQRYKLGFLIPDRTPTTRYYYGTRPEQETPFYAGFRPHGAGYNERFSKKEHWPLVEGGFIAMVLQSSLRWLGIVRTGISDGKIVAFQVTELGAAALGWTDASAWATAAPARALVVQPNFEIVVMLESAGFGLLAELDRFAERVRLDKAALYRLTRESVCRGLQAGLTPEQIEETLRERSGMPLPQNVEFTLREWAELFNRIHVRKRAILLEAETAEELERRLTEVRLQDAHRISPTVAVIDKAAAQKLVIWGRGPGRRVAHHDYAQTTADTFRFVDAREIAVQAGLRSPMLEHRLARVAVPMKNGRFLLDPERVRAAVTAMGLNGVLRFLEEGTAQPLPADARLTIEGWAGKFPALGLGKLTALTAPRAEALDAVMRVPELARHVRRLAPTVALLSDKEAPALRKALEARGVALSENGNLEAALAPGTDPDEVSLLFVKPKRRREIIEQAIQLQRKLLVGYTQVSSSWNATARIVIYEVDPIKVVESTGPGTLVAYSHKEQYQVQFTIQQIQGIRILEKPAEIPVTK